MGEKINKLLRRNASMKVTNSVMRKNIAKKKRASWLFMLPSLIGVLTFFVLPFFVVIYYSLVNNPIQHEFVGLENFIKVSQNGAYKLASSNTIKFSAIAVPLAVILSLFLAVVMESKIFFKSQFRTFFLTPMMVPIASIVLIWQVLFHYNGLVNTIVMAFGGGKTDWLKSNDAQIVIIVLFLWKNLGYNMILFMAALSSVPKDLLEVARLENASRLQIFWMIKMRYLSSTILFVAIMSLINSFKVFREIYLLTGDYPYDSLYMLQHFMNNTFASLDYQKLSAAAIMMALVISILVALMMIIENWYGKDIEG